MLSFRLYYECLEQAHDYILPMLAELQLPYSWTMVRSPDKRSAYFKNLEKSCVKAIYTICTPDILLTAIENEKEYPLLQIEFTEAVSTEDHELQRTYGAVASHLAGMFYVKVAGDKKPKADFGKGEYNPYNTPKILIDKLGYEGFVIADWKTTQKENNLQRNIELPACPPELPLLKTTLQIVVKSFVADRQNWFRLAVGQLKNNPHFVEYIVKVQQADNFEQLIQRWLKRDANPEDRNKLRYFVEDTWIGAKINRFGHAMDPDRGILIFLSSLASNDKKVFGIYALYRERTIRVKIETLETLCQQLKVALLLDDCIAENPTNRQEIALKTLFANKLIEVAAQAKDLKDEVDITDFWLAHQAKIANDVVLQTLAYFLDGIYLNNNGIKVIWDKRKLLGNSMQDFTKLLGNFYHYSTITKPFQLQKITTEVNEDEITYAIVHRVLITNGFKIVAVSYPGAQGGVPILPEPEKGKSQKRDYIDVISMLPNSQNDVLLSESKGIFQKADVEKDTTKLLDYANNPIYQKALKTTLIGMEVIDKSNEIHHILIGVAFGVSSQASATTWQPCEIDFIFRVVDREKWAIGIFNQTLRDLIPVIEGQTNFPTVYQISKSPKIAKIKTPKKTKKSK